MLARATILGLLIIAVSLSRPGLAQEKVVLKILGQPTDAGAIQKNKEQPFFETLGNILGSHFIVEYTPLDKSGIPEADQLKALRSGQVQIASLRISEVGADAPAFLGLDLVGMNTDFKTGRRATDAYLPVLDLTLQRQLAVKLLGVWPFGPQYLFCSKPLAGLGDLKGRKVRVYDSDLAKLIETAGGVPIRLGFAETAHALADGRLDCAVTSPASAVAARWTDATKYVLPIAFQLGINAYAMSLDSWNGLPRKQQTQLASAIRSLAAEIWTYSLQLSENAIQCGAEESSCVSDQAEHSTEAPIVRSDIRLLRSGLRRFSFPDWAKICDRTDSTCSADWKKSVGTLFGMP